MYQKKKRILIFVDYYFPGYKGGGTIRAIVNLVNLFKKRFEFYIVTRNNDQGEKKPYKSIKPNLWIKKKNVFLIYLSQKKRNWKMFVSIIRSIDPDIVYLNGVFSPLFTLCPLIILKFYKEFRKIRIIIAARGQLSEEALKIKGFIKKIIIYGLKAMNLLTEVIWQATSEQEFKDIQKIFHYNSNLMLVPDVSDFINFKIDKSCIKKEKGFLKIVFLSRISRIKNLDGALDILKNVKGRVQFNIYGPLEDLQYWNLCKKKIENLPPNINAKYLGVVPYEHIFDVLSQNHIYFLPTKSENFGYSILEALIAGLPVLISNETPWKDLESKKMGWNIDLSDQQKFVEIIEMCINWDKTTFLDWSENAQKNGLETVEKINRTKNYLKLFNIE